MPFCLCLFMMAWVGLFGFAVSRFGYAWLISAITGNLVILMALDQPQTAFTIAVNRVAEVAIGTGAALLVAFLLPQPVLTLCRRAAQANMPAIMAGYERLKVRHAAAKTN